MYVKRIQVANYGAIEQLDITLPIDDDGPKPVVLVGENGSGKSVLLSHIVNALLLAQQSAYRETPEVKIGKVYKLRRSNYIASGKEFFFGRVDFVDNIWFGELQLKNRKQNYGNNVPNGILGTDAESLWNEMAKTEVSRLHPEGLADRFRVEQLFRSNCVLYFPPDRFEDPAWLNEANLNARAEHVQSKRIIGSTVRRVLNYSPLLDNQNWLFNLAYDFSVFERDPVVLPVIVDRKSGTTANISAFVDHKGHAGRLYDMVLRIVREVITGNENVRLGIGTRHARAVSVMSGDQTLVPNIFQLSSGEISLLNLFLSILRDYDLTGNQLTQANNFSGIVVVDEIDLHLHVRHQCEILPKLMKMFPKIQFIVTSHSPAFVLGLKEAFGENGFGLYGLPEGQPLSPEQFSEFGEAYRVFANTQRHSNETRAAVREAQKPLIFVDGPTDVEYHKKAADLLGFDDQLSAVEFRAGDGMLRNIWKGMTKDHVERKKVIILHDPEDNVEFDTRENVYRRKIGEIANHPIRRGVENLFSKDTLKKAIESQPAFIDIAQAHQKSERGTIVTVPETWSVNKDEKTNLCNWLCANGTADDFQYFMSVLELLHEILKDTPEESGE